MEWWQAYLFWRLDVIVALFGVMTGVGGAVVLGTLIVRIVGWGHGYTKMQNKNEYFKVQNRLFLCFIPILMLGLMGIMAIPTTNTALKMVITKYGVDIAKSDTLKESGENIARSIEHLTVVLEQKVLALIPEKGK